MKKTLSLIVYSLISYGVSAAVNLHVSLPDSQGYQDLQRATQGSSEITSNSGDVITLIQTVNEYLWIAVGVVSMVVFVLGGIKLIGARGDEAVMKKSNGMMLSAVVGMVIAIFSYLIVRLVLNLF